MRKLPTALNGVSVTVNGRSAYICFISKSTPLDNMVGMVLVVVTKGRGRERSVFRERAVLRALFVPVLDPASL